MRFVARSTKPGEFTTMKQEVIMKTYISISMLCLVAMLSINAQAEPAILFKGDFCVVVFPGDPPIVLEGNKLQVAVANAGRGDASIGENLLPAQYTCKGLHNMSLDHAEVQRQPCFIPGTPFGDLYTENGRVVYSPAGRWTAVCKFDPVAQN